MADLLNNGPSAAQIQSMIQNAQGQGGTGVAPILFFARLEANVGNGLSLKNGGNNSENPIVKMSNPAQDGLIAKLVKSMGLTRKDILEGMKKVADAGPVQQASIADITGPGMSGGFAANISSGGRGDFEMGA